MATDRNNNDNAPLFIIDPGAPHASPATMAKMLNVIKNRKVDSDLGANVTIVAAANPPESNDRPDWRGSRNAVILKNVGPKPSPVPFKR